LGVSQRFLAFGHPDSQGFRHDRGNCTLRNTQARSQFPNVGDFVLSVLLVIRGEDQGRG
jgi:hypothetical protein